MKARLLIYFFLIQKGTLNYETISESHSSWKKIKRSVNSHCSGTNVNSEKKYSFIHVVKMRSIFQKFTIIIAHLYFITIGQS